MDPKECAPVALFVYNRADNTRKTLTALLANTLARQTDLYVFSDGGRDEASWQAVREVRAVLHEVKEEVSRTRTLNNMTIVERPENYYLERNIIEGINQVFEHHDTIIVLEDDIVTAPHFLEFMNDAFRLYRDEPQVMHVSGFTRLSPNPSLQREGRIYHEGGDNQTQNQDTDSGQTQNQDPNSQTLSTPLPLEGGDGGGSYFSPFMAGWGWGTWRDRWNGHFLHFKTRDEALEGLSPEMLSAIEYGGVFPCLRDLDRRPIPWDICWALAIRRAEGLCLYPSQTLVRNIGLDAGTHFRTLDRQFTLFGKRLRLPLSRLIQRYEFDRPPYMRPIVLTRQTPAKDPAVEAAMARALTDWGIRYTWFGSILRRLFRWFRDARWA